MQMSPLFSKKAERKQKTTGESNPEGGKHSPSHSEQSRGDKRKFVMLKTQILPYKRAHIFGNDSQLLRLYKVFQQI